MYADLRAGRDGGRVLRREEHELAARVLERVVDQQLHHDLAVHVVLQNSISDIMKRKIAFSV